MRFATTPDSTRAARRATLVGRAVELAAIEEQRRRAAAGELRVLLIAADPGMGKTHLVEHFLERRRRNLAALMARASPFSATAPFGVWVEAIEGYLRQLPAAAIEELAADRWEALSKLLPSVAAVHRDVPRDPPPRTWLLEALLVLISRIARRRPLAVFLDDLHLADASSWEVLDYLARNLVDAPVLVLAAVRPGELGAQRALTEMLGGLEQDGMLSTLRIQPMDRDGLGQLARSMLAGSEPPVPLIDWLLVRSRGNPLFATGLLRALIEQGGDVNAPQLHSLPEGLRERVLSRVQGLEPRLRGLLETLAVLAGPADASTVQALVGSSAEATEGLASLVALRLVAEVERGPELTYELVHPLVQEAIYEGIRAARRRSLHRTVAGKLAVMGRPMAAAAHYARGATPGDEEALRALLTAADVADRQEESYAEALPLLQAATDLMLDGDPRLPPALDRLGWLAQTTLDKSGVAVLRRLERLARAENDPEAVADVLLRLASFQYAHAGEGESAQETMARAVQLYRAAGRPQRVLAVRNEMAWLAGLGGDLRRQRDEGARVLAEARAQGEQEVVLHSLGCVGHSAAILGRFSEAEAAIGEGLELSRIMEDSGQHEWFTAQVPLVRMLRGPVSEALDAYREGEAAGAFKTTEPAEFGSLPHWAAGALERALSLALAAAPWSPSGLSHRRAWVLGVAALCQSELGRPAEARAQLARAQAVFAGHRFFSMSTVCTWAQGIAAASAGDLVEAARVLTLAAEELLEMGALPLGVLVAFDLHEVCTWQGDLARQLAWRERMELVADNLDSVLYRALASPERPESVETLGRLGWRLHRARALARRDDAASVARAAREFEEMKARWRHRLALSRLASLGGPGRRAAAGLGHSQDLSRRERDVAALAAQGLTAREIGERLFISYRTVQTHLEHAYLKLGLESKRELVRRGRELGLLG
ncbi:MAG: AAA family ATPase [Candidatus Dormibacteraeota bacterium]|nr:AAA family ATPase [Candidatus Dormibacteraeota bacterium]